MLREAVFDTPEKTPWNDFRRKDFSTVSITKGSIGGYGKNKEHRVVFDSSTNELFV